MGMGRLEKVWERMSLAAFVRGVGFEFDMLARLDYKSTECLYAR